METIVPPTTFASRGAASAPQADPVLARLSDSVVGLDSSWRFTFLNDRARADFLALGKNPTEAIGNSIWHIFPELVGTEVQNQMETAFRNGSRRNFDLYHETLHSWYSIHVYPGPDGLTVISHDITQNRESQRVVGERAKFAELHRAIALCLSAPAELQKLLQETCEILVKHLGFAFSRIWLTDEKNEYLLLKASAGLYTHLDGPHGKIKIGEFKIGRIADSKQPHLTNSVFSDPHIGNPQWAREQGMVAFAGYPLIVEERVVGVLGSFSRHQIPSSVLEELAPISDGIAQCIARKRSEDALEKKARVLDTLNKLGASISSELNLEKLVQRVTDVATQLSGAKFGAFFYNVINDTGEAYTLYTLSGAPREAFAKFGMPRATPLFGPTFRGEGVIRLGNVLKDSRYGNNSPHKGMPSGHFPVVSYLAVPVISRSGEVLGGLFFGHPEENVFTEETEQLILGIAAQAAIAVDNARLFQELENARKQLSSYAQELEKTVAKRTSELTQTVQFLESFCYSVAHDLRTPLRGMSLLSAALMEDYSASLDGEAQGYLKRLVSSAKNMDALIQDLLSYGRISHGDLPVSQVNLQALFGKIVDNINPHLPPQTKITLPNHSLTIPTNETLLEQVLFNLLSNAVKFVPQGVPPHVQLFFEEQPDNFLIKVSDNGIGIAPEDQAKIFQVFERVPSASSYPGTGIGLAIVRKGVERLKGSVGVQSQEGHGSVFWVRLPKQLES